MKLRKNIYLIIGIILIVLNLITDILNLSEYHPNDAGYGIGYFIGSHIFLLVGIILLRMAYKINRKLKEQDNNLYDEIEGIGSK